MEYDKTRLYRAITILVLGIISLVFWFIGYYHDHNVWRIISIAFAAFSLVFRADEVNNGNKNVMIPIGTFFAAFGAALSVIWIIQSFT